MPEFKEHEPGTFCYAELVSSDPKASSEFYMEMFGWGRNDQDMGEVGIYTQFERGGAVTAAQYQLPAEQASAGVPSHWGQYVSVSDVDELTGKARDLGGEILMGPFDVADYGRMTVVKDPQGAVINLWQSKANNGVGLLDEPGSMCWNELMTSDTDGAGKFYTNLFGWTTETMEMGEAGLYTMWTRGEGNRPGGGMIAIPTDKGPIPPHWLLYFAVEDPAASLAQAEKLGGQAIVPVTDIPNAGSFAVIQDPVGAVFGIYKGNQ